MLTSGCTGVQVEQHIRLTVFVYSVPVCVDIRITGEIYQRIDIIMVI